MANNKGLQNYLLNTKFIFLTMTNNNEYKYYVFYTNIYFSNNDKK